MACKPRSFDEKHRTTTGTYHRLVPNVPQEFDCRVKASLRPGLLDKNVKIKEEEFQTSYSKEFYRKSNPVDKFYRVSPAPCVDYSRNVQEKLFRDPPAPLTPEVSEMKDSYRMNYIRTVGDAEKPPVEKARCQITKVGCEQQPAIPPDRSGYWRWLDPYLTTNQAAFAPVLGNDLTDKIVTFYNASDFGMPAASGNRAVFDRTVFKKVLPNRLLSKSLSRVPNFGMQSEQRDSYVRQCFSDLYPYVHESCAEFEDCLPPASRWQDLAPPGFYCSEYCHLGGWPVRCVVDPNYPRKKITRTQNCCKI